jgi:hypothetical protein
LFLALPSTPAAAGFDIHNALAQRQAGGPAEACVPLAQTGLLLQPLPEKRLFSGIERRSDDGAAPSSIFQRLIDEGFARSVPFGTKEESYNLLIL